MAIKCCKGCVAPERYPGCHDRCPEYQKEKAAHEERREVEFSKRRIDQAIYLQRSAAVARALKSRRHSQKNYRKGGKMPQ